MELEFAFSSSESIDDSDIDSDFDVKKQYRGLKRQRWSSSEEEEVRVALGDPLLKRKAHTKGKMGK